MLKYQQRQMLDILETIKQAQSAGLYGYCQEGALALCDFIEALDTGDTGAEAVDLLTQYCELLFRAHNGEIGEKALRKHFIKIENSVKNRLRPNRIEIVFISYKAAMSDSIESIYLAAKADPDCDAYFIPVPYYNRIGDGSLGEMHYEGEDCYGDHMEITDWQTYDIEERRPDVIYTFAPYDDYNPVSCVHPEFWCEKLRNFTDMLVYVPYTVFGESLNKLHCVTEGCVLAHKVVLESEKVREIFVEEFKKNYGNEYGAPKDKFVALGSPKYERIIKMKQEDFQMPEEWRALTSDKKVILYNLSIAAALEGDEQYLTKLRHVLEAFRNRQEVVLWLRPHPLTVNTYQSMRPHLFAEYMQLIARYRNGGWGIYDDTHDLHRASTWTDAYYGDTSSVALLYLITGKPVIVSDAIIRTERQLITPRAMYITDDNIWISPAGINALCRIDRENWELSYVGTFPSEDTPAESQYSLYGKPCEAEGILYFPPYMAKEIAVYSIEKQTFEKIPYERCLGKGVVSKAFLGSVAHGNNVFFTPCCYPAIIKFDTLTRTVSYYSCWVSEIPELALQDKYTPCFVYPVVVCDSFYLASRLNNAVVAFNMETCTSVAYKIGNLEYRYKSISYDGENFWLSPREKDKTPLIKWHPEKGILREYPEIYEYISSSDAMRPIFCCNNYMWLVPAIGKCALKINIQTDELHIADEFIEDCTQPHVNSVFDLTEHFGNLTYGYKIQNGMFVEFDLEKGERREFSPNISPDVAVQLKEIIASALHSTVPNYEVIKDCIFSEVFMLEDYIDFIVKGQDAESIQKRREKIVSLMNISENVGTDIHNAVKSWCGF